MEDADKVEGLLGLGLDTESDNEDERLYTLTTPVSSNLFLKVIHLVVLYASIYLCTPACLRNY